MLALIRSTLLRGICPLYSRTLKKQGHKEHVYHLTTPNGRGKRRATGHRPTRDKKRGLWPVRFSAGLGGVRRPGTGHTGPLPGRPADPARLRCPARVPSPASHPAPPQLLGTMPTLATRRAGHLTLGVSRCWKPERGTSGGWKQSASGRSAARMTLGREFPALALSICEAGS
jgi:hypothetical protein